MVLVDKKFVFRAFTGCHKQSLLVLSIEDGKQIKKPGE